MSLLSYSLHPFNYEILNNNLNVHSSYIGMREAKRENCIQSNCRRNRLFLSNERVGKLSCRMKMEAVICWKC